MAEIVIKKQTTTPTPNSGYSSVFVDTDDNITIRKDNGDYKLIPQIANNVGWQQSDLEYIRDSEVARFCSGLSSGGALVQGSSPGTISFSSGIGFINDHSGTPGTYKKIEFTACVDCPVVGDGTNYIAIDSNGEHVITLTKPVMASHIYLGHAFVSNGIVIETFAVPEWTGHFQGRVNEWMRHFGGLIAEGLEVTEQIGNPLRLSISPGEHYERLGEFELVAELTDLTRIYNSPSGWVSEADPVDTTNYNNVSTGLVEMTTGYWKKDLVLLTPGGRGYLVYGQNEYTNELDAKLSPLPVIPEAIIEDSQFLAVIVSQKGDTTVANRIHDIRATMERMTRQQDFTTAADLFQIVDVSYSILKNLSDNNLLREGQKYRIVDFRTRHIIPFASTDYNVFGNPIGDPIFNEGSVEPIIVTATSSSTLSYTADSGVYPQDTIFYELVDSSPNSPGDRGRIYYRKDNAQNISMKEDFRATKYRRWKDDAGNYVVVDTSEAVVTTLGWNGAGAAVDVNDFLDVPVFNPDNYSNCYDVEIGGEGYSNIVFRGNVYTFKILGTLLHSHFNSSVYRTQINEGIKVVLMSDSDDFYLQKGVQRVYMLGSFYYTQAGANFSNIYCAEDFGYCHLGGSFRNSSFLGFTHMVVGDNFQDNTFTDYVSNSSIGDNFQNNVMIGMQLCQIGQDFQFNVISGEFSQNVIGYGMQSNTMNKMTGNYIGAYFQGNTIPIDFLSNEIRDSFSSNGIIGSTGAISNNRIAKGCYGNTFRNDVTWNSIGPNFSGNSLKTSIFSHNEIAEGCDSNAFGITDDSATIQHSEFGALFSGNTVGDGTFSGVEFGISILTSNIGVVSGTGITNCKIDGNLTSVTIPDNISGLYLANLTQNTTQDIEITDSTKGVIMTDTVTSTRYRIQVTSGLLVVTAV